MNCSFCASAGAVIARAPKMAPSAIPTCFPLIGFLQTYRTGPAGWRPPMENDLQLASTSVLIKVPPQPQDKLRGMSCFVICCH
jgi:hypothetical protein